jgi:hypothetical protein
MDRDVPEVLTGNARSIAAKKMWERRRLNQKPKKDQIMTERKLDWHLFWTAAGVVVAISTVIIGSYISLLGRMSDLSHEIAELNAEIIKIQTVLIIKGMAPPELFAAEGK